MKLNAWQQELLQPSKSFGVWKKSSLVNVFGVKWWAGEEDSTMYNEPNSQIHQNQSTKVKLVNTNPDGNR